MNKRELEEELKRTSTGRKMLEETEFANPTNDMIGFAKEQCEIFPEDSYMGKYLRETLKMLQAESCEDAISREDVIKAIDRHTFEADDGLCLDEDITIILEGLPHVKPVACVAKVNFSKEDMQEIVDKKVKEMIVRKKGKWIEVDTNMYTCSNCSHCFEIVPEVNHIQQFKCCPNCGAEMENEE